MMAGMTLFLLNGCSLLDDINVLGVCCRNIDPDVTFTLWCKGGSVEAENGANATYRVSDEVIMALGAEAFLASAVSGSMRWNGKKPSEFYACTEAGLPIDVKNGVYGPAEIPGTQKWDQVFRPVPQLAGPMMTERGIPVVLPFSPAVSTVTLAIPPLPDGIQVKKASVFSLSAPVCGRYSVKFIAKDVLSDTPLHDGNEIEMDAAGAPVAQDGWTYLRFVLIPHRYRNLSYSVTYATDGSQYTSVYPLTDEPYGHTVSPFCKMTVNVSLPKELLPDENPAQKKTLLLL